MLGVLVEIGGVPGPAEVRLEEAVANKIQRVFAARGGRLARPSDLKALAPRRLGLVRLTGPERAMAERVARIFDKKPKRTPVADSTLRDLQERRLGVVRWRASDNSLS